MQSLEHMIQIDVTEYELRLLSLVRELRAYERLEIGKDRNGKPNEYLIHRAQKYTISPTADVITK